MGVDDEQVHRVGADVDDPQAHGRTVAAGSNLARVAPQRLDFPREWLTFPDPADPGHEVRADVTWLLSRWTCVYGSACRGIVEGRGDDGCCSHGAFFSGRDDEERVRRHAARLTPATWQHAAVGRRRGLTEWDSAQGERRHRTRTVDGACVFLNRPGFPGGAGCALHALALREGLHPLQTKPDVCWQLPVASDVVEATTVDERTLRTSTVGEFDRRRWGPGGADLTWWCTESPLAHVAPVPLYVGYAAELTALLGPAAYAELARLLDLRVAAGTAAPHPAGAAGPHPADLPAALGGP